MIFAIHLATTGGRGTLGLQTLVLTAAGQQLGTRLDLRGEVEDDGVLTTDGDGITDEAIIDVDGDGYGDSLLTDTTGDGYYDTEEAIDTYNEAPEFPDSEGIDFDAPTDMA